MSRYHDLRANQRFARLTSLPEKQVESLAAEHPGVPQPYLDFLGAVGYGSVGDVFSIYSGLVGPHEIYGAESAGPVSGLWILGDDFQGYCVAFAPDDEWAVVEIDPMDKSFEVLTRDFEQFVRGNLL